MSLSSFACDIQIKYYQLGVRARELHSAKIGVYLLHNLIFSYHGLVFKPLSICRSFDKLPISMALHLPARLRELSLCVDLMSQVHLQKLLLLLLLLKTLLDLIKGLLGAEVWLVIEALDSIFRSLACCLLSDLVA